MGILTALPTIYKVAGALGLLLLLTVGAGILYMKGRSDGAAAIEVAVAKARDEQIKKDAAESAKQIGIRDKTIAELQASKTTVTKVINAAPDTNGCGPAVGTALDWVLDRQRSGAPAP